MDYQLTRDKIITGKNGGEMSEPFTTTIKVNGKRIKQVVGDESYSRSNPAPIGTILHANWSDYTAEVKMLEERLSLPTLNPTLPAHPTPKKESQAIYGRPQENRANPRNRS